MNIRLSTKELNCLICNLYKGMNWDRSLIDAHADCTGKEERRYVKNLQKNIEEAKALRSKLFAVRDLNDSKKNEAEVLTENQTVIPSNHVK